MNYSHAILLVLLLSTPNVHAEDSKFGVFLSRGDLNCLSFGPAHPPKGTEVKIANPEQQFYVEGSLGRELDACNYLEKAMIVGPYFEFVPNKKPIPSFVGIAVSGQNEFYSENGIVSLKKDGLKEKIYFQACTSSEGIHFSARLGAPLKNTQIWHQYFYLGYSVEPSCE